MTSKACEKVEIPIYTRDSIDEKFKPFSLKSTCNGNCLNHAKGIQPTCKGECGCDAFLEARSLQLKDYRACARCLAEKKQKTLW